MKFEIGRLPALLGGCACYQPTTPPVDDTPVRDVRRMLLQGKRRAPGKAFVPAITPTGRAP